MRRYSSVANDNGAVHAHLWALVRPRLLRQRRFRGWVGAWRRSRRGPHVRCVARWRGVWRSRGRKMTLIHDALALPTEAAVRAPSARGVRMPSCARRTLHRRRVPCEIPGNLGSHAEPLQTSSLRDSPSISPALPWRAARRETLAATLAHGSAAWKRQDFSGLRRAEPALSFPLTSPEHSLSFA